MRLIKADNCAYYSSFQYERETTEVKFINTINWYHCFENRSSTAEYHGRVRVRRERKERKTTICKARKRSADGQRKNKTQHTPQQTFEPRPTVATTTHQTQQQKQHNNNTTLSTTAAAAAAVVSMTKSSASGKKVEEEEEKTLHFGYYNSTVVQKQTSDVECSEQQNK